MVDLPDIFPQIEVRVLKKDRMQPGLTLCNLSNQERKVPITAVLFDAEGNVHWLFQHGTIPDMCGDVDVRLLPEGVLIGGANKLRKEPDIPPVMVNWKKEILWKGSITNHHHIHRTPEGNYMFLVHEKRYFRHLNASVFGDTVIECNPETNSVVWEWHLFDHLTPQVEREDWAHCNTIEPDPNDSNSLYLSARNLNSIFKISRKTGKIIWRLGKHGDFKISAKDRFYHQHSPEILPDGNILLFDNGAYRPEELGGEYSKALELSLDEESMEAKAVWSWRNAPDLFTPIWGDANRLNNGNTLIVFGNRVPLRGGLTHLSGHRIPTQTTRIIEVTKDGEKVWELEFIPSSWGVYRAERIDEKDEIYAIVDSECPF
jgi:hypothetical protein